MKFEVNLPYAGLYAKGVQLKGSVKFLKTRPKREGPRPMTKAAMIAVEKARLSTQWWLNRFRIVKSDS